MQRMLWSKKAFVVLSLILLLWALPTVPLTMLRPLPPFSVAQHQNLITITSVNQSSPEYVSLFQVGDVILQIDGKPVTAAHDIQYRIDERQAGQLVTVTVQRNGTTRLLSPELLPRYSWRFIFINTILGLFFWLIGVFVYLRKPEHKGARYFCWACVLIGAGIIVYWWGYPYTGSILSYSQSTLFFLCNTLYPPFVLLFALYYPEPKIRFDHFPWLQWLFFLPGIMLFILMQTTYMTALILNSSQIYASYHTIFKVFRIMVLFAIILSIITLLYSYARAKKIDERKRLQWIFLGIALGTAPFLFLWNVPQIMSWEPLLSEELTYILLLITPICVAFSILKHQALDVHVVINRSLVYFTVTGCILAIYMGVLATAGIILKDVSPGNSHLIAMSGTLVAALLFTPVKDRVQKIVDKTFYRVKYDYRKARSQFDMALKQANDHADTVRLLMEAIQSAIPIEKSLVSLQWSLENSPTVYYSSGFDTEELKKINSTVTPHINTLCREHTSDPIILGDITEPHTGHASDFPAFLHELDIEIIQCLSLDDHYIGFLLFGEKSAQNRYSSTDLDLIEALIHDAIAMLERMHIHDAWLLERTEHQRVAEMNEFKSEFLSHVSHDLRTPLNAIRWSIQNLLDGIPENVSPPVADYLHDMHSCSDHLYGMIEKLLQVTRIDANQIILRRKPVDIEQQIQQISMMFSPLAHQKDIQIQTEGADSIIIPADPGYFRECLVNLIDNALKFSPKQSTIWITTSIDSSSNAHDIATITVQDQGTGITLDQQQHIFDQFAQPEPRSGAEEGLGLGLYITKKLVELHGGSITLMSEPGKGASFTLHFPLDVSMNRENN